jgi:1-acyl-sn-glycerol-3-phosphate acyltransferase
LVKSQIIKYYTKQLIFFLLIAITAAVGILALGVLMPFGMASRANVICGRTMAYLSILLNVKINIEGEEHLSSIRPCVFIMNHQSNMDLPVMVNIASYKGFSHP